MPLYKKTGSPFWWADFRVDGVRHRISTKQKGTTKALQIEAALILKLSSGETLAAVKNRAPLLRDYAENFLAYVAKTRRSEKTKEYYRNGWRLMAGETISGMRIDAIRTSTAEMLHIPGSGSNINCALRTLRRMLSLAVEDGILSRRPRIKLAEEVERKSVVEADVESIILAKAPKTLRDAYLLIADLGIRPDDAVALRQEDIDFIQGDVFIAGGKTGKKAARYVAMSDRVRAVLMERAKLSGEWVFPSMKRGRPGAHMTAHSISSRFSTFKRQIGLPADIVLYSARHTFATDLTEATGNLSKTQKALGHTSLTTTARYNHSRSADIATIINSRNAQRHNPGHSAVTVQ